ncbi:MAG: 4-alpha-glucanotransferase [Nanoarchaeota archaeon]
MLSIKNLRALAKLHGIQISYKGAFGKRVYASKQTLARILDVMGVKVNSEDDVKNEIKNAQVTKWKRLVEPVIVAWDGKIEFNVNVFFGVSCIKVNVAGVNKEFKLNKLETVKKKTIDKCVYRSKRVIIDCDIPTGYHKLKIRAGKKIAESVVISAPTKCYCHEGKYSGYFAPLYSLYPKKGAGVGFRELEHLAQKARANKKNVIATLPLMPTFIETFYNPSPYSPISLLMLNEFYITIEEIPEFNKSKEALRLIKSKDYKEKFKKIENSSKVNYLLEMELKRNVLEKLSEYFFTKKPKKRYENFLQFLKEKPKVVDYAKFMAKTEKENKPWLHWKRKKIAKQDYDKKTYEYYLYCQWIAHGQLEDASLKAKENGVYLYLDLPVGVEPNGFDAWSQETFVKGISVGAPPDPMFAWGQKWGFMPQHPEKIRQNSYFYFINALRNQMKFASFLRIDHVMGLHRLYWVPENMPGSSGAYVSYNHDELYAILSVESHRHKCTVIGENLGLVPEAVNRAMKRHGVLEFSVFQFMVENELPRFKERTVACLNTHDTSTFAGFLKGNDIKKALSVGLFDKEECKIKLEERKKAIESLKKNLKNNGYKIKSKKDMMDSCTLHMLKSPAKLVLINLQDLFLDEIQYNLPGTTKGNWVHKVSLSKLM